ncbi:MAG: NAD(+)/NADH kinase [Halobacteriota archaeon]|nr:NAD(+)/NADH kinase [Halobacteriota archaeon]
MIKPKKVGIVSRFDDPEKLKLARNIADIIEGSVEIVPDVNAITELDLEECRTDYKDADLIICIGGDGTILRTLQLSSKQIPILGVNMGTVGFLADITPEEATGVIEDALVGFETEEKARLVIEIDGEELPYAMNEAVVLTSRPAKILRFTILIDGSELETLRADGVVFATPTGSTAYAMSAGGPIVDPRVDATIIVPLAPYKLAARPSVVPAKSEVLLKLHEAKEATIVIDGQYNREVSRDEVIEITRSNVPALFVKTDKTFFYKVRNKLVLSDTK